MTRLSDRSDPVPDDVWDGAAKYFDEKQLAALVLWIATTNLFNRVNATTRQPAGVGWGRPSHSLAWIRPTVRPMKGKREL